MSGVKRQWHCTCCGKVTVTTTVITLCGECRKLARLMHCPLCRDWFDPFDGRSRRRYPTCPECRTMYQRSRAGNWIPLLRAS